ncbi:Phosphatidylglycerophosphate synthase [Caloramator fervidus]|uniref:Phosphatidylglycerophosphate synthase n=1 Tax=Caloramator fervidus TaxID=29344 RepID=A0A1H5TA59_9CLOT|nr:CDP-alcohol phosphatidyltransferase family protein [Caloramator fervidus]SEF58877.1 Phosphatidylglycerophosphate synthase [Caloramator fervidus]
MLDTRARRFIQPIFEKVADLFIKLNLTPNHVTILALIVGLVPSLLIMLNVSKFIVVLFLWLSGLLDAVDGTLARKTKLSSPFGTVMDITFDRLVEISLIVALALKYSRYPISFIVLSCSIILSMTIFLTVGAVSNKKSEKTFYYQAGLMERTEGFIMFTIMILISNYVDIISFIFAIMILFTAIQRFIEAYNHLG